MVKCDDTYSFHLSADDSVYSDSGSITSSYKARIDSLFRDKRKNFRNLDNNKTLGTTLVQVHSEGKSGDGKVAPLVRQELVMKNTGVGIGKKVDKRTNNDHVTSIRVPSPQAWKGKELTPKEELETIFGGPAQRQKAFNNTRSAVQAQIERHFADATNDPPSITGIRILSPLGILSPNISLPPPPPLPKNPPPPIPYSSNSDILTLKSTTSSNSIEEFGSVSVQNIDDQRSTISRNSFSVRSSSDESATIQRKSYGIKYGVDYLGAIQLSDKATTLDLLQEPLKELYYKYRFAILRGRRPIPGGLHITEKGFRIIHGTTDMAGHYEVLNPFPTIAVWAAVKLVIRREVGEHGQMFFSYAFLPLICDPEAQDKYNLYHELNVPNPNVMVGEHPPMFACVMRKVGVPKVLECHGFICRSSEDAIIIAANLYQCLLENMKNNSSCNSDLSDDKENESQRSTDNESLTPIRPPRKKRSSRSSLTSDSDTMTSNKLFRSNSEDILSTCPSKNYNKRASNRSIKRSRNERNSFAAGDENNLYNNISIPRSKSFITLSSKYDFNDLMTDVKKETGFRSVDDVLKQIISPKGMSFTQMEPKYKELLFKLALTLSKDEIYKKSKNIMRKYKCRNNSAAIIADSDSDASTIASVLKATKKSFSKLGSSATYVQGPFFKPKHIQKKRASVKVRQMQDCLPEMLEMCENYENTSFNNSQIIPKKFAPKTPMPKRLNRIPDGYMSCQECGYETDCSSKCYCSLSRLVSPKAATLPNKTVQQEKIKNTKMVSSCECDTESCLESEKCYCSLKSFECRVRTKLPDLNTNSCSNTDTDTNTTVRTVISAKKQHKSESSSVSTPKNTSFSTDHSKTRSAGTVFSLHPETVRRKSGSIGFSSDSDNSENFGRSLSRPRTRMSFRRRSCSTEFLSENARLHRHSSGSLGSSGSPDSPDLNDFHESAISSVDNLIDVTRQNSNSRRSQRKILLVSAVDPSGKVVYRSASKRNKNENPDTASILSMKKTAEIAALFSELKLNQTTDFLASPSIRNGCGSDSDDSSCSVRANDSFLFSDKIEDTLGYLP